MDDVDVDAPQRPRHRVAWTLGALVAVVFGIVGAVESGVGRTAPAPTPTTNRSQQSVTADQETYLVYSRWQEGVAFATCMTARGFPREPIVSGERARIGRVAGFLGIAPTAPTQWLAPAEARNGALAVDYSRLDDMNAATAPLTRGGCKPPTPILDLSNAADIERAVAAALSDTAFRAYVAEGIWLDEHPDEARLYASHLQLANVGFTPTPASPTWVADLDAVLAFIGDKEGWVTGPREGYGEFSQVVGRLADGSQVIVRVGQRDVIARAFVANVDWPQIECGNAAIIMGSATYTKPGTAAAALYAELAPEVCAALP